MSVDANVLMGEVIDDSQMNEKNTEKLFLGFLYALLEEERTQKTDLERA